MRGTSYETPRRGCIGRTYFIWLWSTREYRFKWLKNLRAVHSPKENGGLEIIAHEVVEPGTMTIKVPGSALVEL